MIVLGSAVGYFLTARLGLLLALPPDHKVGPVWPAAGVALAAALLAGRRALSGVWVGAFSANLADALRPDIPVSFGTHLLVSAGIATGSTLQAAAGAVLLRRWAGGVGAFGRAGGVFRFVAVVPAACLIAATVGTGWVCGGGLAPWPAAAGVWATWWLGDAVGMLLAVPLVVAWARPRGADEPARTAEAAALVVALGVVSAGVFGGPPGLGMAAGPLAYLTVPGLVWAAVRLGRRGAATGLALVAAAAV
ncbi:MAG: MASE1 domain-containing protein, partial [Gemmataceae bacterium]|nr:MASE1 domain-containing protein [Gemmataceae bacterium]